MANSMPVKICTACAMPVPNACKVCPHCTAPFHYTDAPRSGLSIPRTKQCPGCSNNVVDIIRTCVHCDHEFVPALRGRPDLADALVVIAPNREVANDWSLKRLLPLEKPYETK